MTQSSTTSQYGDNNSGKTLNFRPLFALAADGSAMLHFCSKAGAESQGATSAIVSCLQQAQRRWRTPMVATAAVARCSPSHVFAAIRVCCNLSPVALVSKCRPTRVSAASCDSTSPYPQHCNETHASQFAALAPPVAQLQLSYHRPWWLCRARAARTPTRPLPKVHHSPPILPRPGIRPGLCGWQCPTIRPCIVCRSLEILSNAGSILIAARLLSGFRFPAARDALKQGLMPPRRLRLHHTPLLHACALLVSMLRGARPIRPRDTAARLV